MSFKIHIKKEHSLVLMVFIIMACLSIVPNLTLYRNEYSLVFLITVLFVLYKSFSSLNKYEKEAILMLLIFFMINISYLIAGVSSITLTRQFPFIISVFVCIFAFMQNKILAYSQRRFILAVTSLITFVAIVYTCITGKRTLAIVGFNNVKEAGKTSFSTMVMIFSGICFMLFLHEQKFFKRAVWFVFFVAAFYCNAAVLQRGIATFLTVILSLLMIVFKKTNKKNVRIWVLIFSGVLGVLYLSGAYIAVFDFLANIISSDRISYRIIYVKEILQKRAVDSDNTFGVRLSLIEISFKTWTSSIRFFLIGAGDHRFSFDIIGNHSEIIDSFARFGLFGGCIVFRILYLFYKYLFLCTAADDTLDSMSIGLKAMFWIYIIRGFLGTIFTCEIAIQMFIILPIAIEYLRQEENNIRRI